MTRFLQLHLLTAYAPSNLNRDDLGRPKTAMFGNATRLRVSSQSLKRAWRTSDLFKQALDGHLGTRTKAMGREVFKALEAAGIKEKEALAWAGSIAGEFGKLKGLSKTDEKKLKEVDEAERREALLTSLEIEQLAHFSPEERHAIDTLTATLSAEQRAPEKAELALLREDHSAVDIALFGRMLAASPRYNTEAAAQVAHALTVHKVAVEDDFFSAVDDLNAGDEDKGAGHLGETEFGAGLFYQYICIDRTLLRDNLPDAALTAKAIAALIEAAATVAPTGKQNSFASRARASYILAEKGDAQPRSLAVAFMQPVGGNRQLDEAIQALEQSCENQDKVYGPCAEGRERLNAVTGKGSLAQLIAFATE